MAWYCVFTKPGCERLAAIQLQHQLFTVLHLTHVPDPRKHPERVRPLFARYLFVAFDWLQDDWRKVRSTPGVARLFSSTEGRPIEVPEASMDHMRALQIPAKEEAPDAFAPIHPGTKVRILSGSFSSEYHNIAICSWSDSERVKLLYAIMGREIEIEFERSEVEPV